MIEEIRTGSSRGIELEGISFGQRVFSMIVAFVVTALLIIIPSIVL